MQTLVDGHWLGVKDGDPRLLGLYKRHYSAKKNAALRTGLRLCIAPGQKFALLTSCGRAAFVWVRNTVPRWDGQEGVCCTLFRNEGAVQSSDLIREASALAWQRWPGERLFSYVDPTEIRSTNPGFCFLAAGWRRCGVSKGGLVILEVFP